MFTFSQQRAFESIITQSILIENIRLQINLKKIDLINVCTMRDIVIDITTNNANFNLIQRDSLQK